MSYPRCWPWDLSLTARTQIGKVTSLLVPCKVVPREGDGWRSRSGWWRWLLWLESKPINKSCLERGPGTYNFFKKSHNVSFYLWNIWWNLKENHFNTQICERPRCDHLTFFLLACREMEIVHLRISVSTFIFYSWKKSMLCNFLTNVKHFRLSHRHEIMKWFWSDIYVGLKCFIYPFNKCSPYIKSKSFGFWREHSLVHAADSKALKGKRMEQN